MSSSLAIFWPDHPSDFNRNIFWNSSIVGIDPHLPKLKNGEDAGVSSNVALFLRNLRPLFGSQFSTPVVMTFPEGLEHGLPGFPEDDFASVLTRLVEAVGCSQYRLAEVAEIDRPYLHRLCSQQKRAPSRQTVVRLGAGLVRLGADILAMDELLWAAGYAPIFVFAGVPYRPGRKGNASSRRGTDRAQGGNGTCT